MSYTTSANLGSPRGRLPFGPGYRIPRKLESSHILLMGDTGSGKSTAIRQLLRQVQERGYLTLTATTLTGWSYSSRNMSIPIQAAAND